ncbi:MAG: signal peptide peptidase SppA [Thermodesulfobacteriota bacterium]|nr:signal peptide peptidase SppA [Thermodesulfobacteriota bacterium]
MRKHPVIFGLFLLVLIIVSFFIFVYGVSTFTGDRSSFSIKNKIGVVTVEGVMKDSSPVVDQLVKYGKDDSIKAVVLRIDSPGGGVVSSQEIYEAVLSLKKKKKVVASMGSVAASGGYYVACAADKIVANPGTITGNIGVVVHFSNVEELLKKIGLKSSVVKSGRYKDIGSPLREMTADEKRLIQEVIDDIYDQFLEAVSSNRKIPKGKVAGIADGRIFTGRQALKMGLVDFLGDKEHAINLAAKLSGIKGKPDVVYPKEKELKLWKYIVKTTVSAIVNELREESSGISY